MSVRRASLLLEYSFCIFLSNFCMSSHGILNSTIMSPFSSVEFRFLNKIAPVRVLTWFKLGLASLPC